MKWNRWQQTKPDLSGIGPDPSETCVVDALGWQARAFGARSSPQPPESHPACAVSLEFPHTSKGILR